MLSSMVFFKLPTTQRLSPTRGVPELFALELFSNELFFLHELILFRAINIT